MIPIQELRVGNWINCKTKDGLQTGRIDSLQEVSNTIYFISAKAGKIDYKGKVTSENDCFEPVPITEEILLKCGFEQIDYKFLKKPYVEIYETYNDWFVHIDDEKFQTAVAIPVEYLHQLQNAYYLVTNKELEIEL